MNIANRFLVLTVVLSALGLTGCSKSPESGTAGGTNGSSSASPAPVGKKKKIAYVTNGVDPFWNTAQAGVRAAEKEMGIECEVHGSMAK